MQSQSLHVFERRVASNLAAHGMLADQKPVIVAVSGGADSVALLSALRALGCECVAAHCNYHLRGEESNRDMRAVQQLCRDLGVDLYVKDMDVPARRAATGESVEMACRELRYAWFADLLDRQRAQAIAVAHHREDNVETLLLNMLRGSGITGLTGIRWRNGYVVRPLLDFSRAEIEGYLADKGLAYVVDSTNAENVYARNRLRNLVVPLLEREFPGAVDGMLATISHVTDNRALYDACVQEKQKLYLDGNALRVAELLAREAEPRMLLFEILRSWGFNMTQVDNLIASASRSGISFCAGDTMLELDRGVAYVRRSTAAAVQADEHVVSLRRDILAPAHVLISEHGVAEFKPERDARVAYFDVDILCGSPRFVMRRWRRGDRMRPYGMEGSRLLSDIMSDAKLSAEQKRSLWILTRDDEVVWALGLRASGAYSIHPETRRYLRLQWRP